MHTNRGNGCDQVSTLIDGRCQFSYRIVLRRTESSHLNLPSCCSNHVPSRYVCGVADGFVCLCWSFHEMHNCTYILIWPCIYTAFNKALPSYLKPYSIRRLYNYVWASISKCALDQDLYTHERSRKKLSLLQRNLAVHDCVTNSCTCVIGRCCYAISCIA